ncbi:hypothetical protein C4K10_3895 [Pseudomonas chlororaphis subsp. aureofaciens]|nr:hypothetical protein C4K10_3895 [Pseudomonas chlororaphis subsp. aureofaciens]
MEKQPLFQPALKRWLRRHHREQARSYKGPRNPVGASLLAIAA